MNKIGWIGIGNMGSRMAKRLQNAGYNMTVCDTVEENTKVLQDAGAGYTISPAEATKEADFIFTMIPNSDVLLNVIEGEDGIINTLKNGSIVIDMSTVAPDASSKAAEAVERKGCSFLRAPVTGSTLFAEQGKLGILASGDSVPYEKALPLFKILGNKQYYLGTKEEARYMKLAINMMMGTSCQMLAESLVFGESVGLDWEQMLEVFADSAAGSPLINYKVAPLKKRDFNPSFTIKLMEKDIDLALDVARKTDLSMPVTSLVRQLLSSARATGRGDLDFSALLLLMEDMAGLSE